MLSRAVAYTALAKPALWRAVKIAVHLIIRQSGNLGIEPPVFHGRGM